MNNVKYLVYLACVVSIIGFFVNNGTALCVTGLGFFDNPAQDMGGEISDGPGDAELPGEGGFFNWRPPYNTEPWFGIPKLVYIQKGPGCPEPYCIQKFTGNIDEHTGVIVEKNASGNVIISIYNVTLCSWDLSCQFDLNRDDVAQIQVYKINNNHIQIHLKVDRKLSNEQLTGIYPPPPCVLQIVHLFRIPGTNEWVCTGTP